MNEQEIPFEESVAAPEMEYTGEEYVTALEAEYTSEESVAASEMEYTGEEPEKGIFFPEYRNDGKLILHKRPRRDNLRLVLIPSMVILAVLLFSYVVGYAFYAPISFSSWHQNELYDHPRFEHQHFPQKQFDQPNQPNQQAQPGQPIHTPSGTMPRIFIHHLSGQITGYGAMTNQRNKQ